LTRSTVSCSYLFPVTFSRVLSFPTKRVLFESQFFSMTCNLISGIGPGLLDENRRRLFEMLNPGLFLPLCRDLSTTPPPPTLVRSLCWTFPTHDSLLCLFDSPLHAAHSISSRLLLSLSIGWNFFPWRHFQLAE